jgi:hypothetical protein
MSEVDESKLDYNYVLVHLEERVKNHSFSERFQLIAELSEAA